MKKLQLELSAFITHLRSRKTVSAQTIKNYTFYLARFLSWASANKVDEAEKITDSKIAKYRLWLSDFRGPQTKTKLKSNTINYHLIALRRFFNYLKYKANASLNSQQVGLFHSDPKLISTLTDKEVSSLLSGPDQLDQDRLLAHRDRAILELIYCTGLKVSAVSKLKRQQLALVPKALSSLVLSPSSSKPLSHQAVFSLQAYLRHRHDTSPYIFLSHDRALSRRKKVTGLSPRSIQRLVEKYKRLANITKTVTPQTLRHSYAQKILLQEKNISSVQKSLGHTSLLVSKNYLKKLI